MNEMDAGLRALEETSMKLIGAVQEMSKRLNTTESMQRELATQQEELKRTQERVSQQKGINIALGLSIILDIVLSVAIGFGYVSIDNNADQITTVQERTSDQVLCPLYELFITSLKNPPRPELVDTPEERKQRKEAKRTILASYAVLECPRR